jgi:hypothetical protein
MDFGELVAPPIDRRNTNDRAMRGERALLVVLLRIRLRGLFCLSDIKILSSVLASL